MMEVEQWQVRVCVDGGEYQSDLRHDNPTLVLQLNTKPSRQVGFGRVQHVADHVELGDETYERCSLGTPLE